MGEEQYLKALMALEQRVLPKNQIQVMHGELLWTAGFEWHPAAAEEQFAQVESALGKRLPPDYRTFLRWRDGAVLYKDIASGQWGFRLFGTADLVGMNTSWAHNLRGRWQDRLIAFGDCIGEASVFVFDPQRPTSDGSSFAVLEGDAYEPVAAWPRVSRSFHEWIDHLVTAQGDKYWLWH